MTAIRFEEPAPLALRRPESLTAFATALQQRPNTWALLGKYGSPNVARQTAYTIRHSLLPAFAGGGYEAEARTMLGEYRVYVRYTGTSTAGAA
ncbi:hypothetical protein ACWEG1_05700 [Streptomyces bauhiniae]